jgi:hypothetical protein
VIEDSKSMNLTRQHLSKSILTTAFANEASYKNPLAQLKDAKQPSFFIINLYIFINISFALLIDLSIN